jgi:hypothetical protein
MVIEAWWLIFECGCLMRLGGFHRLHSAVGNQGVVGSRGREESVYLCRAVDLACVFYFKRVLCLQRSAAAAVLLRRHGWNAELVIGANLMPFQSHAWVEVDGCVVNDKPYMKEMFRELARC